MAKDLIKGDEVEHSASLNGKKLQGYLDQIIDNIQRQGELNGERREIANRCKDDNIDFKILRRIAKERLRSEDEKKYERDTTNQYLEALGAGPLFQND